MHQVLLPGAPLFLAHVADGYDVTIHEARLVFLLCCMSLVFGNVFPALGHLVVLILCMVKTKNIDHIVFVTSCASYSYPEGKHRHEAQSKKYESVAHGRGICYSATLLIWNQVPEFMQPELEVTLFFFSGWCFPRMKIVGLRHQILYTIRKKLKASGKKQAL